jgi:hypothetical protein
MKTTVKELERRVAALPPDFAEHVISWHGNLAHVKSFSSDHVWDVSIMMGTKEGELRCTCTCPSTKVCHHITAFYAVAKKLGPIQDTPKPDEGKEPPPDPIKDPHTDGMKMITGAIEQLVNGIGLLVDERMKEG